MLLISFAWFPKFREFQVTIKKANEENTESGENALLKYLINCRKKTARQKITAITSFFKILLTLLLSYLLAPGLNVDRSKLLPSFRQLGNHKLLNLMLINIICGYMSQLLAKVLCRLSGPQYVIPLFLGLSMPISVVFVVRDVCKSIGICLCQTGVPDGEEKETWALGACLLLAQLLSTFSLTSKRRKELISAKESRLFWVPSYDGKLVITS